MFDPSSQSDTSVSYHNNMLVECYQLSVNKLVEQSVWASATSGI